MIDLKAIATKILKEMNTVQAVTFVQSFDSQEKEQLITEMWRQYHILAN